MPETDTLQARAPSYRITFGDLRVGETARRYLREALERHWVSEGPNVRRFEAGFAQAFAGRFAVATSSGTDAGIVAMQALLAGVPRGQGEVITPALAFAASANCILAAGGIPKFVDVELSTLNIDPAKIEAAIGPRTRAIQVVHTMGKPCAMDRILELARRHHLPVVEDCCEAHGATLAGRKVGTFGRMGLFSFYAAHLICSGEGGMILTDDEALADLCRCIRTHGRRGGQLYFHFDRIGFNAKMNDLEAAIGLEGLEQFPETFRTRRRHLTRLWAALADLEDRLILYRDGPAEVVSPHAIPLVLRDPQGDYRPLYQYLESQGIQCKTLFGSLPTQHRAFAFLGEREGAFPVAERIGRTGLHFGVHQHLSDQDIDYVSEKLHAYFR